MAELRAASGLTFEDLAERAGMSRRSVIAYERGETFGTMRYWYRISAALGVPFSNFVESLD